MVQWTTVKNGVLLIAFVVIHFLVLSKSAAVPTRHLHFEDLLKDESGDYRSGSTGDILTGSYPLPGLKTDEPVLPTDATETSAVTSPIMSGTQLENDVPMKLIPKPRQDASPGPFMPSSESSIIIYAAVSSIIRQKPTEDGTEVPDNARYLDIFYQGDAQDGDWIGVFDADPVSEIPESPEILASHVLAKIPVENSASKDGIEENCAPNQSKTQVHLLETNITTPEVDIAQLAWPPKNKCLGLWIAYFRSNQGSNRPIAVNCLKIQPEWMRSMSDLLATTTLTDLFIPGSTNSGVNPDMKSSEVSQDENISSQLLHGIRYLEFQLGFATNVKDNVYVTDDAGKYVAPLLPQILELKEFLNKTEEVVFVHFRSFHDFHGHGGSHDVLLKMCLTHLGAWMAPRKFGPQSTMSLLWATNKRLILMYADDEMRSKNEVLWEVPRIIDPVSSIHAIQSNKIPVPEGSVEGAFVPKKDLNLYQTKASKVVDLAEVPEENRRRKAIRSTNSCFMRDFHGANNRTAQDLNLVAIEFFQSSFLVDLAIQVNYKKAKTLQSSESYAAWLEKEVVPREKNFTSGGKINLWHSSRIDEQHLKPILIGPRKVDALDLQK